MTPVRATIQVMRYHCSTFTRTGNARYPEYPQQAGRRSPGKTGLDANGVTT